MQKETLRKEISKKELVKLYDKMRVDELAKHFGVSRPIIYKFLKICRKEKLITTKSKQRIILVD